jgi:predicted Fe-Mo cluster-binding NifX family protein
MSCSRNYRMIILHKNYYTMKRVAIPVSKEMLSENFGQCNYYRIYDIEAGIILRDSIEIPPRKEMPDLPVWAAQQGITDVVVHKIDKQIISLFAGNKINLFVGVSINTPELLIEDYLNGNLKSNEQIIKEITE